MGFLEERLGGTEDIRGIGAESHHQRRLASLMLDLMLRARRAWLANARGYAITNFLFIVGYSLGLAIGASLYLRGEVSIGAAFVIVYYIGMLAAPLQEIRGQAEQLQEATAGVNRVGELLALAPQVRDAGRSALAGGALSVEFDAVSFRYPDSDERGDTGGETATHDLALDGISFRLAPGRVLGVLGRTGSGKTTVTRLLLRLYDPEEGAIRLGGADVRDVPLDTLRSAVGLVTQDVQLFGATVRENIMLFEEASTAGDSDSRVRAALDRLGLAEWIAAMPHGLDTRLAPGGGGMSAGEAQLLAFAARPHARSRPCDSG